MGNGSNARRPRHNRPEMERLEGRALLSSGGITGLQNAPGSSTPGQVRRLAYTTPDGTRVAITLYGSGTLAGSTVDANGVLDLEFAGTNQETGIVAQVHGGTGRAKVGMIKSSNVSADATSGIGSSLVNIVNLRNFDLVDNGRINLAGGVHVLMLNSVGANTQLNLREIPSALLTGSSTATSYTTDGVTLGYSFGSGGGVTLSSVGGNFTPETNLLPASTPVNNNGNPGPAPAPPGVVLSLNHVNGPSRSKLGLGAPAVYAFDQTKNAVVRFDLTLTPGTSQWNGTEAVASPIVPAGSAAQPSVTLAKYHNATVVLVDNGDNVYAYDPLTLQPLNKSFSLNDLKTGSTPMTHPDRLGSVDGATVIGDPQAGSPNLGMISAIDVSKSLDSGQVVAKGSVYSSQRAFGLSGGMSGVAGLNSMFSAGGGYFDQYQPTTFQFGMASLRVSRSGSISESSRSAVTLPSGVNTTDQHGQSSPTALNNAMGSLNTNLALITSRNTVANTNTATLYNPSSLSAAGSITLQSGDALSSLSQTAYPALAGAALIDVQGNMQSFRAQDTYGLVLHDQGGLNLTKIQNANDTTIIASPVGHVRIPVRNNVVLESTTRNVGTRNAVVVNTDLKPTGPLSLP